MNVFAIQGGNRLVGEIDVAGSKNCALALMSAVLLVKGTTVLTNIPDVSDIHIKASLLQDLGAKVSYSENTLVVDATDVHLADLDEERVRLIRTSFYLLGPLLARLKEAVLPAPGGCRIGQRPVDFHLKGLELLGAEVTLDGGFYRAKASKLVGAGIYFDFPSAGATQHLMCTAALAEGITVIQNAAIEPEVTTLAEFLNRAGARIEGAGTNTITIMGVESLHGVEFRNPADRLQAGTFLLAGAITQGDITVNGILPENQAAMTNKLREMGALVEEGPDWVRVAAPNRLHGIRLKTMPYPGFPTDMQQPITAVLCLAEGQSMVEESIYESRTGHVPELARMGARIRTEGGSKTFIHGVSRISGATVHASDLRAGAALVLAGLAAEGETIVKNIHFIDRGYENFEQALTHLGAGIERRVLVPEVAEPPN